MPEVVVDDLPRWRECKDCGLFQRLPDLPEGEAAICARCDALLRRVMPHSVLFARINAVCATLLFVLALALPLVKLDVLSRSGVSTVFSGPSELREQGFVPLAIAVFAGLVVMPATKLIVQLAVLFGMGLERPPRWLPWLFGWLDHLSPWAMVEVFLLGSMVAYSRLKALAHVDVGLASLALGGTMLAIVAVDATLDREAIWHALEAKTPLRSERGGALPRDAATRLIGCTECRRVDHAREGDRCVRCGHRLSVRKGGLDRIWALVVAAALLYIPANVLPVMTIKRLGKGGPTTILRGVIELAQNRLWPLALLLLLASIIVPLVKLVSLISMLAMTHVRSRSLLKGRTRLFRFIKVVGRWSMIDVFMLSVLVGVVRFGTIASVLPGMGAPAFCAVVLITMAATELFDPRFMWDAAGRQEQAVARGESARATG